MADFLLLAFLFLVAGIVAVPLATRLGLGSVLGYLLAGIVISPILQALGVDVISLQHFAEFGVVMMLFLVGLELEPERLWALRSKLLGLGGLQVAGTTLAVMLIAMWMGQAWQTALAIGLVFSLSSTAIVLQTLNEKGLMRSDGGQASFSVLLFQDIAVIFMLALVPLLAFAPVETPVAGQVLTEVVAAVDETHAEAADDDEHSATTDTYASETHADASHADDAHASGPTFVDTLEGWQRALVTIAAIGAIILGGRWLTTPLFKFVSMARSREMFTATALLLVVGIALLMGFVGLSAALGTFLAGVVLANSEYRHELESDIDPFKGLLLGLFFITVGAGVDFSLLLGNFTNIILLTLLLLVVKSGVLLVLTMIFRVQGADRWLFALGLAQTGEFAFVLLSFTVANQVLPQEIASQISLIVTLSMLVTPLLFIVFDKLIAPRYSNAQSREADEVDEKAEIIIAGHGRVGGLVNRIVSTAGHQSVVLDYSSEQLEFVRRFGVKVYFGDATRPDLLHAAGISEAKVLVVAIDDKEQITEIVHYVSSNYPNVHIVARAVDRDHVYALYEAGCRDIIRETFDSSLRTGRSVLEALGFDREHADQHIAHFRELDSRAMVEMAAHYRSDIPTAENQPYIDAIKKFVEEQSEELRVATEKRGEVFRAKSTKSD